MKHWAIGNMESEVEQYYDDTSFFKKIASRPNQFTSSAQDS